MSFLKRRLVINPDLQYFKDICKTLVPATQKSFRDQQHRIRFCCCSSAWVDFWFKSFEANLQTDKTWCEKEQQVGPWVTWHLAKIEKFQSHLKFSPKTGGHQQLIVIVLTVSLGFTGLLLLWVNSYLPDYYYLGSWGKKKKVCSIPCFLKLSIHLLNESIY